jgi:hypothetical protein
VSGKTCASNFNASSISSGLKKKSAITTTDILASLCHHSPLTVATRLVEVVQRSALMYRRASEPDDDQFR